MYRCRSGRHTWFEREDAEKCCSPEWERVLVMGGSFEEAERKGQELEGVTWVGICHGAVYGYGWQRKGRKGR